jgi:hypothetical protein
MFLSQPVLEYRAMESAQKAHSETSSKRLRGLFLNCDTSIIQNELVDAVLQVLKMIGVHRVNRHKDHGLGLFESRERLDKLLGPDSSESVANFGLLTALHAGIEVDIPDLTRSENCLGRLGWIHDANLTHIVFESGDEGD